MTDTAAIQSRHYPVRGLDNRCLSDDQPWPCDARVEGDRADRAERRVAEIEQQARQAALDDVRREVREVYDRTANGAISEAALDAILDRLSGSRQ